MGVQITWLDIVNNKEDNKMKKSTKRTMRRWMWLVIAMLALCFGAFMYFSSTFLAGMLIIRKVIYIVLALIVINGFAHFICDKG